MPSLAPLTEPAALGPTLTINGTALVADISGAAFEPVSASLLVADMHFEKGSAYAARGQFLPPYDTRETLRRLSDAIERLGARRVIALGDSFHDLGADGRIHDDDARLLSELVARVGDWVWIEGNHDPEPPARFGGRTVPDMRLESLILRHEPTEGPCLGEVAGHLHPCAKVSVRGRGLRKRCFAANADRLVLPAFGAFTGGLNVRDGAWDAIFPDGVTAWMMGDNRIVPVSGAKLRPD